MDSTLSLPQKHSDSDKEKLIREWLFRFALNAGTNLTPEQAKSYVVLWLEGFADIDVNRLAAAFAACLRSHTFKTIPTIGDVRQHINECEMGLANLEAERTWQKVLTYALSQSPDYPAPQRHKPECSRPTKCDCPPAVRISERTQTAIRSSGGLTWIASCPPDQVSWCKKAFVESYLNWKQLEKDVYLLPEGEVKAAILALADAKQKQLTEGRP